MPRRNRRTGWVCTVAICLALAAPPAMADDHDAGQSGHPLRIAAYVLYPIGWMLDYLIFQPAHKIGNSKPLKTFFGHRDDYRETVSHKPAPDVDPPVSHKAMPDVDPPGAPGI